MTSAPRETDFPHKIAILATGDEISQGDIINSNSQDIALRLTHQGMQVRMHMVAPDSINEIEQAIQFLLTSHQALIITGGLGPTSDDLTRYALSKVTERPLVFDNATWDALCARLKRFGYDIPPENNRQQALFPQDATIIPNPNGTAAGCFVQRDAQLIFMLPGPPQECLPMVDSIVLPTLIQAGFKQTHYHHKWLLFGVSEGQLAEELDLLAKPYDCVTGYRLCYPYLEFKLHSRNATDFAALKAAVEAHIAPYLVGDGQTYASQQLQAALRTPLEISDTATGGLLETTLLSPATKPYLAFTAAADSTSRNTPSLRIQGLREFWEGSGDGTQTTLTLTFQQNGQHEETQLDLPFRNARVKKYAVELICRWLLSRLDGLSH